MKTVPYFYTWSAGNNSDYKTPTLMSALQKYGLKIAVVAFENVNGNGGYSSDVPDIMDDIKSFKQAGGGVAVSWGGEASAGIPLSFATLDAFTKATGIKYHDFDVEGSAEQNDTANTQLAQTLVKYIAAYPDCFVSLTLPVMPDGLDSNGLHCLNVFRNFNVKLSALNIMTMDYGPQYMNGRSHGDCAISAAVSTVSQLHNIWPDMASYAKMIITPMIGKVKLNSFIVIIFINIAPSKIG